MRIYLTNEGRKSSLSRMKNNPILGNLLLANSFSKPKEGITWALDNGAFHHYIQKTPFDETKFLNIMERIKEFSPPEFIVLPDKVAAGMDSFYFSLSWLERLPKDYNYYFALQDGMPITWVLEQIKDKVEGVFIGGTIKWKEKNGERITKEAHKRGLKVHIGRCGTMRRMLWAKNIGVDSIDSCNINRNGFYHYIDQVMKQDSLEKKPGGV